MTIKQAEEKRIEEKRMTNDGFQGYMVVSTTTPQVVLHWVVYHTEELARKEAAEWLSEEDFAIKPIMRRMR